MENFFKNDGTEIWDRPTWWQAVLQVIVFIVAYEVCAYFIGVLVGLLLGVVASIPVLSWLLSGIGETVVYTFTPALIAFAVIAVYSLLFKKYYMNIVGAIITGMVISFTVVSQLIGVIATYGISWTTINQIWFDVILCGLLFMFIISRVEINK